MNKYTFTNTVQFKLEENITTITNKFMIYEHIPRLNQPDKQLCDSELSPEERF